LVFLARFISKIFVVAYTTDCPQGNDASLRRGVKKAEEVRKRIVVKEEAQAANQARQFTL